MESVQRAWKVEGHHKIIGECSIRQSFGMSKIENGDHWVGGFSKNSNHRF